MKRKRLNRDLWGFQMYPYYQMRIDCEVFHGIACLIQLEDGEPQYWDNAYAGRLQVAGAGMSWLQLIPDGTNRVITVKYFPEGGHDPERRKYPKPADERYQPSVWYVDITEGIEYDPDGVVCYIDKYLDVIFLPEGEISVSDRDELDAAYESGELTKEQYDAALDEGERIQRELCTDIGATDARCAQIRNIVEQRIAAGEPPLFLYHGSQYDLDVIRPQQVKDRYGAESQPAVYASKSAREELPSALPSREDPNGKGYIYRVKSDIFKHIDDHRWVSFETVQYLEKIEVSTK